MPKGIYASDTPAVSTHDDHALAIAFPQKDNCNLDSSEPLALVYDATLPSRVKMADSPTADALVFGFGLSSKTYGTLRPKVVRPPTSVRTPQMVGEIDTVDPDLVGRVGQDEIEKLLNVTPSCCEKGLKLLLPSIEEVKERTEDLARQLRKQMGQPKFKVGPEMAQALRKLEFESGLYEHYPKRLNACAYCNGFFVEKSAGLLRVICDARPANALIDSDGYDFSLFTVETLIRVISNLSAQNKEWFAVNTDLRHWFHQLRLPNRYKKYLVYHLPGGDRLVPVAVPMGWTLAPFIAQSVTWGMVLAAGAEDIFLSKNSGLIEKSWKEFNDKHNTGVPPTWLPIRDGGGIFIILDNICVVTNDRDVAKYWKDRIAAQTARFEARLKPLDKKKPNGETIELLTMNETSDKVLTFLGVEWKYNCRRVALKETDDCTMPGELQKRTWKGTHRELASLLGKVLWWARVSEIRHLYIFPPKEPSPRQQEWIELSRDYAVMIDFFKHAAPADHKSWDIELSMELSRPQHKLLEKYWNNRCSGEWITFTPLKTTLEKVRLAAVDASSSDALKRYGYIIWKREPAEQEEFNPNHYEVDMADHKCKTIAVAELEAIYRCIVAIQKKEEDVDLIVMLTDSMNAKAWIERGYSIIPEVQKLLKMIFLILKHTRLYLRYIRSEWNLADLPSRLPPQDKRAVRDGKRQRWYQNKLVENDSDLAERCRESLRALKCARDEAKGEWCISGPAFGGSDEVDRRRQREEDKE